jgi:hypothetical protein
VLILASSVQGGQSSREAEAARARGIPPDMVHVVTPQEWSAMSAHQFMEYRAIIIGDAACQTGTDAFAAAVANRSRWGAIIDGNVVLVGANPSSNQTQQLVESAVGFALKQTGINGTGLYVALGCAYKDAPAAGTHVELLEPLGEFKVAGVNCAPQGHAFDTSPGGFGTGHFSEYLYGHDSLLTGAGGCAARAVFTEFPRNTFVEAAIALSTPQTGPLPGQKTYYDYDGAWEGSPYILLVGNAAWGLGCGDGFPFEPETCDLGDQGNGRPPFPGQPPEESCSYACQLNWCGDGAVNSEQGEQCDEGVNNGRTRDGQGDIGTCSAFCKVSIITDPNRAPEAHCKDVTVVAEYTCGVDASIDDGSNDPEDGQINCVQDPPGPFATGTTTQVTLLCTDSGGLTDSCTGTVKVTDQVLPTIALNPSTNPAEECTAGATYADPGATAEDLCEGILTDKIVKSGSVNMGSPGQYSVLYAVEDSSKNKASATRPVTVQDTRKPTLELNGLPNQGLECGTPFNDLGARANDQCAGNLTSAIVKSGSVDHMKPNPYTIRYNVKDPSGRAADEVSRVVLVTDTTAPVLTPRGPMNINLECGDGTYVDEGATATDSCAGTLPVTVEGAADQKLPGTYHIRYRAQDPSGNEAVSESTRTVTVSDTRVPTVTLNGPANLPLECGATYTEQGATGNDLCDGPLTPAQSGVVDPTKVGNYTRTYTATDAKGLAASATRQIPVTDTLKPVVTPRGSLNIQLECGDGTYQDEGANANDACDGVLTATSSPLPDQKQPGTTVITYKAKDNAGNEGVSTAQRTVTVSDTKPPTIELNGSASQTLECKTQYVERGAVGRDLCDGALTPSITGVPDTDKPGDYTVRYRVVDGKGFTASADRNVKVQDTLVPTVTLKGALNVSLECGAGTYTDEGADANDACAGPLTPVPEAVADQGKAGVYKFRYKATDPSGNTGTSADERTVTVSDTLPPELRLLGTSPMNVECKTPFADPGAEAEDQCAGILTDAIVKTGGVDTDKVGSYTRGYSVTDGKHTVSADRPVVVRDTLKPTIDVNGPFVQDFECGSTYVDPGATANDLCAGDLTDKLEVTQTPNQGHDTSFTITYKVKDPSGNEFTSPTIRTVNVKDNLPPTLVVAEPANLNLECGDPFTYPSASADDACFGDITSRITRDGNVDNKKTGSYLLTYRVTDQAGNAAPSVQRTVAVNDTLAPIVTVNGDLNVNLECGAGPYNDQGATANDKCDGVLTATPDRLPDPKATGSTTIKYTATDKAGRVGTSSTSRTVTVSDTLAPTLALKGPAILPLECATPYVEQGASANDLCAGTLDGFVQITGSVNSMNPQDYTLTYNVKDPIGLSAPAVSRKVEVRDTTKPSITVLGPLNDTHACGTGPYVDPGATANDLCYGNLTAAIEKTQEGNPNAPGSFKITYKVKDPSNNEFVSPVERNVTVNDTEPPTIELLGESPRTLECGTPYVDPGARANDLCFGDVSNRITRAGSVEHQALGSYVLTYNVTDPAGQSAATNRTVNVVDHLPPSLTVLGPLSHQFQCGSGPYVDPGFEATDVCAGNLNNRVIVTGLVNPGAAGQYTLSYSVSDPSGNRTLAASARTVTVIDDTAPTITLEGSPSLGLECGTPFTDPGAKANDLCAGDLSAAIVREGEVNHRVPNNYPLTYTVTDPSGHTATTGRTVTVSDTLAPTLALNGSATQTLECGSMYVDPGATATDACVGDLTAAITREGTVNPSVEGNYQVTYNVKDPGGHAASPVSRTVTVDDTLAPTILVNGPLNQTHQCGSTYTDPGATANDACYGDQTSRIVATRQNGNPNQPGSFTITYSVTDQGGNSATSAVKRTVTVQDTAAPVLELNGLASQVLECGTPYVDPGAKATDACFGDLTASIQLSGTVNSGAVGTYPLVYNVTDAAGNTSIPVSREVKVQDTTVPSITVLGPTNDKYECGGTYQDPGAIASDTCAGNLTPAIVATRMPVPGSPGSFTISYSVQDPSGNQATSSVTRTVAVNDDTPPTIVLNGQPSQFLECSRNPYVDPGARATDVCMGGSIPYTVEGGVNTQRDGIYTLRYWAVDNAGNRSQTLTRTVEVNDSVGPAITLNGSNPVILECALSQYVETGATAEDVCSGPAEVTIDASEVDGSKTGAYKVNYAATDLSGNVFTTVRNVLVEDHTQPVLTIGGPNPIRIECGIDMFQDPPSTAIDACQGDVSHLTIREFTNLNRNVEGNYFVRYLAQDGKGNLTRATRDIEVDDSVGPILSVTGSETPVVECGSTPNLKDGVRAVDLCYGSISPDNIDATVERVQDPAPPNPAPVPPAEPGKLPKLPGQYVVTYTAKDPVGNLGQNTVTRTFTVVDDTLPELCAVQPDDDGNPDTPPPCLPITDQDLVYECTGHGNNEWQPPTIMAVDQCSPNTPVNQYNTGDDDQDGIPGCDCNYFPCGGEGVPEGDDPATACDEDDFGPGVSTENEGLYYVQYLSWDDSYNITGAILSVYVQDTIKPTITLNPVTPLPFPDEPQHPQNYIVQTECYLPTEGDGGDPDPFVDPGATAQDICYGDLNQELFAQNDVTKHIPGTYAIEYTVRDGAYNWADPVNRLVTVQDTLAPAVTVKDTLPLFPANNEMRTIDLTECVVEIKDRCEGFMNINNRAEIAGITCSGPNCDPSDYKLLSNSRFKLRVQAGNNYTVPFTVLDNAGNASASACTFTVLPALAPPLSSPQSLMGSGTLAGR